MSSFDIVSEVDTQEVTNAVDQSNREIVSRFDFRGVEASFDYIDGRIRLSADAEIQIDQMLDILRAKLVKRNIDPKIIDLENKEHTGKRFFQNVTISEGVDSDLAKRIVKMIKGEKLKVQTAIQGDQVRISGKKRDDLQKVIALIKEADLSTPLQFKNFRD